MGVKLFQESELGGLPVFPGGAAREVRADDGKLAAGRVKTQLHIATLRVELLGAVSHPDVARYGPGVDAHTGITLLLRKMEMPFQIAKGLELARNVRGLGFDFLDANTIGLRLGKPGFKAFAGGGTDAVQVQAG